MSPPDLPPLIGESRSFLEAMEATHRVAPLHRPVLVVGERGTGKELVAARLHYLSMRWNAPMVTLNCATLPDTLLEAELFGHEAGAFTGAVRRRVGRFERADGGTLFLDEIANAPMTVQEKILRAVEYGAFERVGASETVRVDVRLVAAANVDLPAEVAAGRFRADLLDRLAFDVLTLPPLRARTEDIALLANHFASAMAAELGWNEPPRFSQSARDALLDWPWPGNVRELKNVVERSVYRWPDSSHPIATISFDPFDSPWRPQAKPTEDLPERTEPTPDVLPAGTLDQALDAYEQRLIMEALTAARFNQRVAAERLGLSYHQLRGRLKKHGLNPRGRNAGDGELAGQEPTGA